MRRGKIIWASGALVLLTLAALINLYQILFDVWMTAYPFADAAIWRTRLSMRLITISAIGLLWSVLVLWVYRQMRHSRERQMRKDNGQSSETP